MKLLYYRVRLTVYSNCSTLTKAYSPLAKARRLDDATLVAIAAKHGMTTAQIMIRWSLQLSGMIALPKSMHAVRIAENFAAAALAAGGLDAEDMVKLNELDEHLVTGWDPPGGYNSGQVFPGFLATILDMTGKGSCPESGNNIQ